MTVAPALPAIVAAVDWGPVAAWAGAAATVLVVITTSLVALGFFDRFVAPRLTLTFDRRQPWCRHGKLPDGSGAFWVRLGVENSGRAQAEGCVGRVISAAVAGKVRDDVDPVQMRWAGIPHSRAFDPLDIRPGQREFLDVLCLEDGASWRLVTFEAPDFDAGFVTEFKPADGCEFQVSVFTANGSTATTTLVIDPLEGDGDPVLRTVSKSLPYRQA